MIKIKGISIHYDHEVLKSCDITLPDATFIVIKGESGAGKSSLLYRIGLISKNQDFNYSIMDKTITQKQEMEELRKIHFGYVLQDSALFDHYDVLGNLELYAAISGFQYTVEEYKQILSLVHLDGDLHQSIATLSGGERQRLAIACALCKQADVLILDEVTSSLDEENEIYVLEVLKELVQEQHRSIILASHSEAAISYADVIYEIQNQTLICTKNDPGESQPWKPRTSSLSFEFYKRYIQYFFRKYAQLNRSIIAIMSIAIFTLFTAFGLFRYYTQESMSEFSNLYQTQAFITNAYVQDHADDVLLPISKEKLDFLDGLNLQGKLYPFISAQLMINGTPVWILPDYNPSFFDKKQDISYQKDGILMSKDAYDLFQSDEKTITTQVLLYELSGLTTIKHEVQEEFVIRGVLNQMTISPYMKGTCFIYMDHEQLEELYYANASSTDFGGYTMIADDYHAIQQLESDLYDVPMGLNSTFCDTKTMASLDQSVAWIKGISITMVTGIFFLMLIAFQVKYLFSRSKEFALLNINGMSNRNVGILLLLELSFKYVVSILSAMVMVGTLNIGFYVFGIGTIWPGVKEAGFIVLFSFFVCVVLGWCMSVIKVNRLLPEKVLRS